jgi:hypothetical protein
MLRRFWIGVVLAGAAPPSLAAARAPAAIPKMSMAEGIQLTAAAGFGAPPRVHYLDIDGHGKIVATGR